MTTCEGKSRASNQKREADHTMRALTELFSTPEVKAKAHHRCAINGPTEIDVLFETALDEVFGHNANSDYKLWIRQLYKLRLISNMPDDWKIQDNGTAGNERTPQDSKSPALRSRRVGP
jgi:hypothetical protein